MENEELQPVPPTEDKPQPASPKKTARKRPVSRKAAVPRIEVARSAPTATLQSGRGQKIGLLSLLAILAILALGIANLFYVTWQSGQLEAMADSYSLLRANYSSRHTPPPPSAPAPVAEEKTAFVFSLADANDRALIQAMVSEPATDYYKAVGRPLSAVLIERQKPLSKFIRVRLFFKDGGEADNLWPFTSSRDDWWLPACVPNLSASSTKTQCPADYLAKYPDIARLLAK